jgi:hypothetical protein
MRYPIILAVPAALLLVGGCDKSNDNGAQKAASSSPPYAAAHSADAPATLPVTPPLIDPANPSTSSGPGTATVVTPTTQPAQGVAIQAQVDQAMQYVKDHKFDLAEQVLNQLDQQKTNWSTATRQAYDPKIDMARKALNAAKGGSNALDQLKGTAFPSK